MNFVTINQLNKDITQNIEKIPKNTDLIVGIPKSGLLVATLIALQMNLPMTDIDGLLESRVFHNGTTKIRVGWKNSVTECQNILVVDDSVYSGKELSKVKERLNGISKIQNVIYMAGYVTRENCHLVDIFLSICDLPRVFEWNYMHHPLLSRMCVDIDGVLCRNPNQRENDDGENYRKFLKCVEPRVIPTYPVGCLVTCRLEKYRDLTEEWLHRYGIRYEQLIMMRYDTAEQRRRADCYGEYKAEVYKRNKDCELFIESSQFEAETIYSCTGKNVFCVENVTLYEESRVRKQMHYICTFQFLPVNIQKVLKSIKRKVKLIWNREGKLKKDK